MKYPIISSIRKSWKGGNKLADHRDPVSKFEVSDFDLMGRRGILEVRGRKVETPELMPVVNPNKLGMPGSIEPSELKEKFRFDMIITNSYIIRRTDELRIRARNEGLHRMLAFDGVIMTDSGTFQSYMYGKGEGEVDVEPLEIVEFQRAIGSDIGTILDRFTVPGSERSEAENDLNVTLERAENSMRISGDMELAVPVQGGRHLDLRTLSGKSIKDMGVSYAPIGGVVPIMESYDYSLLVDVITSAKKGMGPALATHLFGAGHPMIIPLATALGCDLFDSASYIKFAYDSRYMTKERTYHLKELEVFPCSCPVCSKFSPGDLADMQVHERTSLLARHNLWVLRTVIDEVRSAIREGTLWELVERSAMSNPQMYAAVRRLKVHSKILEQNAPRSTRRFMCNSSLSLARPEFTRYRKYLETKGRLKTEHAMLLTDWTRTHSRQATDLLGNPPEGIDTYVRSPLGPYPYYLVDMYPLGQAIFPPPGGLDEGLSDNMDSMMEWTGLNHAQEWDGRKVPEDTGSRIGTQYANKRRAMSLIRYQFASEGGFDPVQALFSPGGPCVEFNERIILKTSRKTGKIRNIISKDGDEEVHILSLRAEDGILTLRIQGAERLRAAIPPPWRRVMVDIETGEFNAKGLNVFCKFVISSDPDIRPGDEVMVVDTDDRLLAVGRAQGSGHYLEESRSGIGVKVREGILSGKDNEKN